MAAVQLPTFEEEIALAAQGFRLVAGIDEAGAGAWAGPVFAGAVILKADPGSDLVRDSKMLSPGQRERAAELIRSVAVAWAVGSASAEEIDRLNIRQAGALAMRRAVEALATPPNFVLIDAFRVPGLAAPSKSIIRGDAKVMSIAAASIMAKVARDALMRDLAERYPGYGFEEHKGYGTALHQRALKELGVCPEHRRTYDPVRRVIEGTDKK